MHDGTAPQERLLHLMTLSVIVLRYLRTYRDMKSSVMPLHT